MASSQEKSQSSPDDRVIPSGDITSSNTRNNDISFQDRSDEREDSENASVGSSWTESTDVPKRHIGVIAVISLMINQMIGTGVFETPGYVLYLTGSKQISLLLWAVGGIYTLMSGLMYLEYGTALPYVGGPLIWLDEAFHRPAMLATTIFAWFWIILCASGNCESVALYIDGLIQPYTPYNNLDFRFVRFLAIIVQTLACLLLYFMRRACFMFSGMFAVFKIVVLLVFFAAGMAASRKDGSGIGDFKTQQPGGSGINCITAMIYVIYSYQGWEHTNYIAGEIKQPNRALRWGVFLSIGIVTALYLLVTSAYYAALSYATIEDSTLATDEIGLAVVFARVVFGSGTGTKAIVALSAWSQVVAYTYTTSKVKQAIAWQRIIPFYKFFGKQDLQFDSPGGALVLHWIFTVASILIGPINSSAYAFNTGLFTYGYQIEMIFLGIGLFRLTRRMRTLDENWRLTYFKSKYFLYVFGALFGGVNVTIVVIAALPHQPGEVPDFYWPVAITALVVAATLHWAVLQALQRKWLGKKVGFEVRIHNQDDDEEEDIPDSLTGPMRDAIADGSRRRVEYKVTGRLALVIERICNGFKLVGRWLQ